MEHLPHFQEACCYKINLRENHFVDDLQELTFKVLVQLLEDNNLTQYQPYYGTNRTTTAYYWSACGNCKFYASSSVSIKGTNVLRSEYCANNLAEMKNRVSSAQQMINCCSTTAFFLPCCLPCCYFAESFKVLKRAIL